MPLLTKLINQFDKNEAHEKAMWDFLCDDLQNKYKEDGSVTLLLGNFSCESQIDALFVSKNSICILEFKSYSGEILAGQNECWYADNKPINASGGLNPYAQVRRAKFQIADRVEVNFRRQFPNISPPNWLYTNGRVVFNDPITLEEGLDNSVKRWFSVAGLSKVASELLTLSISGFKFSNEQIEVIERSILNLRATPPRNRVLYVRLAEFNDSRRAAMNKQGEAQVASNIFERIQNKIKKGEDISQDQTFDEMNQVQGLRAFHLSKNYRLLAIHFHGVHYLLKIDTLENAQNWANSNDGLKWGIDRTTWQIHPIYTGESAIHTSAEPTPENIPLLDRLSLVANDLGLSKSEYPDLWEINENSEDSDIFSAIQPIKSPPLRQLLEEVLRLLRGNKVEAAQLRVKYYFDEVIPLEDAPNLQQVALDSGANSENYLELTDLTQEDLQKFDKSLREDSWMFFLHPLQHKVVEADLNGPAILTGVSGSGKTSVLLHRAKKLAIKYPNEKILVLAFNSHLADVLSRLLKDLSGAEIYEKITVTSYHKYLSSILTQRNLWHGLVYSLVANNEISSVFADLLATSSDEELEKLLTPLENSSLVELFTDFLDDMNREIRTTFQNLSVFLESQDSAIDSVSYIRQELDLVRGAFPNGEFYKGYLGDFDRQGRAIPFQQLRKEQILQILNAWEDYQLKFRFLDQMAIARLAHMLVSKMGGVPSDNKYRCVLVDEFQDFSSLELSLLLKVPTDKKNGLFLTGDFAQKLYTKKLQLSEVGLGKENRHLFVIRKNYRNTREILDAAYTLLSKHQAPTGHENEGIEVLNPELAARHASKPTAYQSPNPIKALWEDVAHCINVGFPSQSICIISANTDLFPLEDIIEAKPHGLDAQPLSAWACSQIRSVAVSDIPSVKGFEFRLVLIIGVDHGVFPPEGRFVGEMWRDAQHLYIAMTRGMDEVRFYYEGRPSQMLLDMGDKIDNQDWSQSAPPEMLDGTEPADLLSIPEVQETENEQPEEKSFSEEISSSETPQPQNEHDKTKAFIPPTVVNGYRTIVFLRPPNQNQLAAATNAGTTYIANHIFTNHSLTLRPDRPLAWHLVESVCASLGYLAELRFGTIPSNRKSVVATELSVSKPITVAPVLERSAMTFEIDAEGLDLGGFILSPRLRIFNDEKANFEGQFLPCEISEYRLTGPDEIDLKIHDVRFLNGERFVACGHNATNSAKWERLVYRLRQGSKRMEDGTWIAELNIAKLTGNDWSNRFMASIEDLNKGSGLDVNQKFDSLGSLKVGTKREVYGETNNRRNRACVRYGNLNTSIPVAAYVVTTILPLYRGCAAPV